MEHGTCSCTACTAAARVRDRDAWGRTPAGRLRTTLPRPCRARHALRDARRGGGAHRLLVLVAHSGSPKTARANYAPKTLPLWQGAKAESAQRACLSAAAGCGQRCRARSERRERRDGRAREAAPAHVHASAARSAGWMTSAWQKLRDPAGVSHPSAKPMVSAGAGQRLRRAVAAARVVNSPPPLAARSPPPSPRAPTCACAHRSCVRRRLMDTAWEGGGAK